ncbi:TnsA endonuclease N-terminal domain-containing protein [Rhodopseudomonas palustris]|uniref:TnsA endonuclease N-terminal domain-containing protein n=1 Tax=Rhodopseudomonas palustris TaxID=1076 RepID=UPI0018DC9A37|nr:TnsA endonuclease N-terminal domain-containing protein [Rhodopseudomonas palustris]
MQPYTLDQYLAPDPCIRDPLPSPTVIRLPRDTRASRKIALRSKGSARAGIVIDDHITYAESHLEFQAMLAYSAHPDVVEVREQPPSIEYVDDDGEVHDHTFDLAVTCADGRRVAVFAKPAAKVARRDSDRQVELLAAQTPREFADEIKLLTENDLTDVDRFNAAAIRRARQRPDPADDEAIQPIIDALRGPTTIGHLMQAAGIGSWSYDAIVRAVADRRLVLVEHTALDHDAVVERPSSSINR